MAGFLSSIKALGNGLGDELSQFMNVLGSKRVGGAMGDNYRLYGASFGVYDYEEFVDLARSFFMESMMSDDPAYTVIEMPKGRKLVDYDGNVRGIYDRSGAPVAFFRPNYRQLGYANKDQELEDIRRAALRKKAYA